MVHGQLLFLTLAYWVRFAGALAFRFMYHIEGGSDANAFIAFP